jgi:hypothetical protein
VFSRIPDDGKEKKSKKTNNSVSALQISTDRLQNPTTQLQFTKWRGIQKIIDFSFEPE